MKIVCFSDTHGLHNRIATPPGDVAVFSGDVTSQGKFIELEDFLRWMKSLPYKHKVVVAGNHDFCFQTHPDKCAKEVYDQGGIYLRDNGTSIQGLNFWGMPWQPWFYDWAFNLPRDGQEMLEVVSKIPDDTHVLITHGPPEGLGDMSTSSSVPQGCKLLRNKINQMEHLKLHVFGHMHESRGTWKNNDTICVNASCLDRRYVPWKQEPYVVEL